MYRFRVTPPRLALAIVIGSVAFAAAAYGASLGISSKQLAAWSQTLTKGSCNQTSATAYDTYVDQKNSGTNYGASTTLGVQGSPGASHKDQDAFIRFDLSACNLPATGGADNATLTLYVTSAGGDTISLYPVYSSWDPNTLTWSNMSGLTIGSTATTSFTPSSTGFYTLNVTADVDAAIKAGALWGWQLVDASGSNSSTIASSKYGTIADRPTLALSYEK